MNIILLGAPGAGKGTQAGLIVKHFQLKLVGTGDLFRKEIASGSALGKTAESFVKKGQLVPDDLVFRIIDENITVEEWEQGLLFDGFPRTVYQAEKLDRLAQSKKKNIDAVLFIDVPDAVVIDRLVNRWICSSCGYIHSLQTLSKENPQKCIHCTGLLTKRPDDNPETAAKRLVEYKNKTEPILAYYKEKVIRIDGSLTIAAVTDALIAAINRVSLVR